MIDRINILHISDFHYSSSKREDQAVVIDAFFSHLNQIIKTNAKPNMVLFTGDIINDPDEDSAYSDVFDFLIAPLLRSLDLDEHSLILVPGNHDAKRSYIEKNWLSLESFIDSAKSSGSKKAYVQNADGYAPYGAFNDFFALQDCLQNKNITTNSDLVQSYYFKEFDTSVVTLNSAAFTRAGLKSINDRGELVIAEQELRTALASTPNAGTKILAMHHPLDWLTEESQGAVKKLSDKSANFILCGHLHQATPSQTSSPNGTVIHSQAGALFTDRDYYNGYSIISLSVENPNLPEIRMFTYYDQREAFDVATNVSPNGIFYVNEESRDFWSKYPVQIDPSKLGSWIEKTLLPEVKPIWDEGLADRPVSEVFVSPPLVQRKINYTENSDDPSEMETDVPFDEIASSNDNYLISGYEQYGKSTLLTQIALNNLMNSNKCVVPLIIHFSDIKVGSGRIERELRRQLPEIADTSYKFDDILSQGYAVVLIDDLDFAGKRRINAIEEFVRKHPKNKYVFSYNSRATDASFTEPEFEAGVPFNVVHIKPFTRNKLRQIVSKWDVNGTHDTDKVLDRISTNIAHINVPATGANATIMLSILEAESDFAPINRSVLVERFIELLLHKYSISNALRERFDFRNQAFLLSCIAEHMVKNDKYRYDRQEMIGLISEFLLSYGLKQNSDDILNNFISSKIFNIEDNIVFFRYRFFTEYFVSYRMNENDDFKNHILEEKNYLSFINEIEFYSGLKRSDLNLLCVIGDRFRNLQELHNKEVDWDVDLNNLSNINIGPIDNHQKYVESVEKELEAPPLTDEERDEIFEYELPQDAHLRQDVFRPNFKEIGHKWTWCLMLYSGVLKNMEMIDDDQKRFHLSKIIEGWGHFLTHSLLIVPSLVKNRKMVINGIVYHVIMPKSMGDEEVARSLYLMMPRTTSDVAKYKLGTEKLEQQLLDADFEKVEPLISRFFRRAIYSDLKLPGYIDRLSEFISETASSKFVLEALVWKLRHIRFRTGDKDPAEEKIRTLITDGMARLLPGSRSSKSLRRAKIKERLDKSHLLERLQLKRNESASDD